MKVIFCGAQGTGKTTILNMFRDMNYPVITEVVRSLVRDKGIKINEQGTEESQKLIFKTYKALFESTPEYISDRGLIDVVSYTCVLAYENDDLEDLKWMQLDELTDWFEANPDVKVVYFPIEFNVVDDGVRSMDEGFRSDVDFAIKTIIEALGLDHIVVTGTPEERFQQIWKYINETK